MNSAKYIALRVIYEITVWYGLAFTFLFLYITFFSAQYDALYYHLRFLTSIFIIFIVTRFVFLSLFDGLAWITALIGAGLLLLLLIYYALVFMSLFSWGRVISWEIIVTYAQQITPFVSSQGMSPAVLFLASSLFLLIIAYLISKYLLLNDWVNYVIKHTSKLFVFFLSLSSLCIAFVMLSPIFFTPWCGADAGEPFSLTFYPDLQSSSALQGHLLTSNRALDSLENKARLYYSIDKLVNKRNIIVIVADALRPDHMQALGYEKETTPYLHKLVHNDNVEIIDNMWSICAQSSCGLLAMASSKYIHQFTKKPFNLLDVLKLYGYRTEMILGGDHTNFYGLRKAYGDVDSYYDGSFSKKYYMNDDLLVVERIAGLNEWDNIPTFMQLHLMSTHYLGKRKKSSMIFQPSSTYAIPAAQKLIVPAPNAAMTNYYDNGVRQLDQTINEIINLLEDKKYLNNTLVVITADHGEMLGEHGQYGHSKGLNEGALRIPFILLRFGYESNTRLIDTNIASQIDIAPTILKELGMQIPVSWMGKPLQDYIDREYIFFQQMPLIGLIDTSNDDHIKKYWYNTITNEEFCYDISEDPDEDINLINTISDEQIAVWRLQLLNGSMIKGK
jgi:glucan phosphoethanolaminetransferase (alkaline phosphatase superfamily)